MTYELAKKLKDAGFPMNMTDHELCVYQQVEIFEGVAYHIPTLSELIEACGDVKLVLKRQKWEPRQFTAKIEDDVIKYAGLTPPRRSSS